MKTILLIGWIVCLTACQHEQQKVPTPDAPATGIRGVWVPAPRFTPVLSTYENVKNFVALLDSMNMNAIFLCSYAETKTVYQSEVLKKHSTYATASEGYLLQRYTGNYHSSTGDPVRDLIDEAHRHDIRVFFWFEYGFMGEGRPIPADNPILGRHPEWAALGNDGQPANYNKSDYYFNAYRPEVQEFLLELVAEALTLYPDLDGIQGDDRMPAMPRNSGYDPYTTERYRQEHDGTAPPADYNDPEWVRWRLDILNAFAGRLYRTVKEKNPKAWVSFSPNPYPWCEENLMQAWPAWCASGSCDLLAVQCYRYTTDSYRATVNGVREQLQQLARAPVFAPGIILTEKMTPELLEGELHVNRQQGLRNEIFFYNQALENPAIRLVLEREYREKVRFPELPRLE